MSFRQVEHTNRSNLPRSARRLRAAYNHVRSRKPPILELVWTRWHGPMDEPRADCSGEIRIQEEPSDKILRLLRPWNGDIRNHQREHPISRTHRYRRFCESDTRRTPHPRRNVPGGSVEDDGVVLDASTRQPAEHNRRS